MKKIFSLFLILLVLTACGNTPGSGNEHNKEHDHKFVENVLEEATCEKDGLIILTCEICKYEEKKAIKATGHEFGDWNVVVEPTTSSDGLSHRVCMKCEFVEEKSIPKLEGHDHEFNHFEFDEKNHWFICECGEKTEQVEHNFSEWEEKETGKAYRHCLECEYYEEMDVHVHDFVKKYDETHHWNECDCGLSTVKIEHEFREKEINGKIMLVCISCKFEKEQEHIHSPYLVTDETYHYYVCECGETISKEEHIFGEWIIVREPTEELEGIRTRFCSVCNIEFPEFIDKLEHVHNHELRSTQNPTCTEIGSQFYYCKCGDHYYEYLEALGHDYVIDENNSTPSTCENGGYFYKKCSRCSSSEYEYLEALGHNFEDSYCTICEAHDSSEYIYYSYDSTYDGYKVSYLIDYSITSLNIPQYHKGKLVVGIDNLRDGQFKEVVLPSSVIYINSNAFSNMDLDKVVLPNVKIIGEEAFSNANIKYLEIGDNLESVSNNAFSANIEELHICLDNVNVYDKIYSYGMVLDKLVVSGENIIKDAFSNYNRNYNFKTLELKEGIVSIGDSAFARLDEVETIILPDSLINIGKNAFDSCYKLVTIVGGDNLVAICDYAFSNCYLLENFKLSKNLEYIGVSAFNNSGLKSVCIPEKIKELNYTFSSCNNLEEVTFETKALNLVGDVFYACESLKHLELPALYDNFVMNGTFSYCTSLESVILPNNVVELIGITDTNIKEIEFPDSIVKLEFGSNSMVEINLPKNLKYLGSLYCPLIENLIIPDSVEEISFACLSLLQNIKSITLPSFSNIIEGNNDSIYISSLFQTNNIPDSLEVITLTKETVLRNYWSNISLDTIVLPECLEKIEASAFDYSIINELYIPKTVKFDKYALSSAQITDLYISNTYDEDGNIIILKDLFNTRFTNNPGYGIDNIHLYDVKEITDYYFSDTYIGNVILPSDLETIGNYAFYNCHRMTNLDIPNSVTSIGERGVSNNFDVNIPNSLVSVGPYAFASTRIKTAVLSDEITIIPEGLFYGTYNLESISMSKDVTEIGDYAFYDSSIKDIDLTSSLDIIGEYAFYSTDIEEIKLPVGLEEIGDYAFYQSSIEELIIPDTVINIGTSIVYNFSIKKIVTPFIGANINDLRPLCYFYGLSSNKGICNLVSVEVTESAKILEKTFADCASLEEVKFSSFTKEIGTGVFENCSSLTTLTLPLVTENMFKDIFGASYNSNKIMVRNIELLEGVTNIYANSFARGNHIRRIILPSTLVEIANNSFKNINSVVEIINYSNLDIVVGNSDFGGIALNAIAVSPVKFDEDKFVLYEEFDTTYLFYIHEGNHLIEYIDVDSHNDDSLDSNCLYLPLSYKNEEYRIHNYTFSVGLFNNLSYSNIDMQNCQINEIGSYAFSGLMNIEELTLPIRLDSIADYGFYDCDIKVYNFVGGDVELGDYAFSYSSVKECNFTDSQTSIGNYMFYSTSLSEYEISSNIKKIGNYAFAYTYISDIFIPSSVEEIGAYAFEGTKISELVIPETVKFVGEKVVGRNHLRKLTVPYLGASIDDPKGVSYYTTSGYIYSLVITGGTTIINNAFSNTNVYSVSIPGTTTSIAEYAFSGSKLYEVLNVDNISLGDSLDVEKLVHIGIYDSPSELVFSEGYIFCLDTYYQVYHLVGREYSQELTGQMPGYVNGKKYYIERSALDNYSDTIYMTKAVIGIAANNLASASTIYYHGTIEDWMKIEFGSNIGTYGGYDLYVKNSLDEYELVEEFNSGTITTINNYQLSNIKSINKVTIKSSCLTIGEYAFYNSCFDTIIFEEGLKTIKANAFRECTQLKNISLPESLEIIEGYAFAYSNLEEVTFITSDTDYLDSIGEYAFGYCFKLKSVSLPNEIGNVYNGAFYNSGITEIYLPKANYHDYLLSYCSDLKKITIAEGVTTITKGLALYAYNLNLIVIPKSVILIQKDALSIGSSYTLNISYAGTIDEFYRISKENGYCGSTKLVVECIDGVATING